MSLSFVCLGLDHRHIYGMSENMIRIGARPLGYWTDGTPGTLAGFAKRFPDMPRFDSQDAALASGADLALVAGVPEDRADVAIAAMRAGMDVMVDKPGCTTLEQLARIRACVAETGRIWSINFSERFEVPSVTLADQLVAEGAIGRVVHTTGLGPHRLNRPTRPDWFFNRQRYGGILTDIASHQIDQFLHFTGSESAEIIMAHVANHANPSDPGLQDFGELSLRSAQGSGYIRVDWYTPDALPNWGDGRLTLLGTEGYIELRKYVDVAGRDGTDTLILANGTRCEAIDAREAGLPYFDRLAADIADRTETAMTQCPLLHRDGACPARASHGRSMIRAAILGGGIGAEHFAAYRALPGWHAAMIVDQDPERRAALATDGTIGAETIEEALASDVDVIDICLPPALHAPVAIRALAAGKHVICEKPLATSLEEADAMEQAAREADKEIFPVFQYRFGPAAAALRALGGAGLLGAPRAASFETHWARDAAYYAIPWRGTWAGEMGGSLITHAIHAHDLLSYFMAPIAAVTAQTATLVNQIETEDSAAILFELQGGALATSSVTLAAARDETRLRLVWEHLTATSDTAPYAPATGLWRFEARDPARQQDVDDIVAQSGKTLVGFQGFLHEVSQKLAGAPTQAVPFAAGRASLELATALYASARSQKRVTLPLAPDHPMRSGWRP
ncbi:Gfo/Idh/MocA family protein [Roseobacteraceae bacterium S113]